MIKPRVISNLKPVRPGVVLVLALLAVSFGSGCLHAMEGAASTSGGGTTSAGGSGGSPGSTTGAPACNLTCETHRICELVDGGPTCACVAGYQSCPGAVGETCDNLDWDPESCGACGNACPSGEVCDGGACACDLTLCPLSDGGLECVDLTSDTNCGGCGVTCTRNQDCDAVDGGANCTCVDGGPGTRLESCDGTCADTNQDPFNCGGCGNVCVSGACTVVDGGMALCDCPSPYTECGLSCVDLLTDALHCGSCDMACDFIGEFPSVPCEHGRCPCGPTWEETLCPDGTCVPLTTDPLNCGECGHVCVAPTAGCVDGGCVSG